MTPSKIKDRDGGLSAADMVHDLAAERSAFHEQAVWMLRAIVKS